MDEESPVDPLGSVWKSDRRRAVGRNLTKELEKILRWPGDRVYQSEINEQARRPAFRHLYFWAPFVVGSLQ
jgi:hypothetical protein